MAKKAVPSTAEAARLAALAGTFTWLDVVEWQEELGMHRGVIFDGETQSVKLKFRDVPVQSGPVSVQS
jgi:hypothetical protein